MSENQIVKYKVNETGDEITLSPQIVRDYLVSGNGDVTNQEVRMFLELCKFRRLNPFLKEAYLIKYGNNGPASIVVGKDVFQKRAAANEQYDGLESGIYVLNEDGEVTQRTGAFKLPGEDLVGAWARAFRKDWGHPVDVSVSLDEYMGRKRDGSPTRQWSRMPGTMLVKVAEAQALRKAFPEDFSGLYESAEIDVSDEPPSRNVTPEDEGQDEPPQDYLAKRKSECIAKLNEYERKGWIDIEQLRAGADYVKAAKSVKALVAGWQRLEEHIMKAVSEKTDAEEEGEPEEEASPDEEQDELFEDDVPEDAI